MSPVLYMKETANWLSEPPILLDETTELEGFGVSKRPV